MADTQGGNQSGTWDGGVLLFQYVRSKAYLRKSGRAVDALPRASAAEVTPQRCGRQFPKASAGRPRTSRGSGVVCQKGNDDKFGIGSAALQYIFAIP